MGAMVSAQSDLVGQAVGKGKKIWCLAVCLVARTKTHLTSPNSYVSDAMHTALVCISIWGVCVRY